LTQANTDCYSTGCHITDYTNATTPVNHIAAAFPTSTAECSSCHDTVAWTDGQFTHTANFPLQNSHQLVPTGKATCEGCHNGNYTNLTVAPTDCWYGGNGCHANDYKGTTNPNHVTTAQTDTAFQGQNCSTCHTTTAWNTATFDHSTTGFPLTGAHQMASAGGKVTTCDQCHNGNYNLPAADAACSFCHTTDFNNATTPVNHITTGFPIAQCATCHDTIDWTHGKFDHSTTGWALTGYHLTTATCDQCHGSGTTANYNLTAANTVCYGCHTTDWNNTASGGGLVPNHPAAPTIFGPPVTCDTCHTTTAWTGATFNHTWFPIPHHSSVCADCHQVSTTYSSFSCINCHTDAGAHGPGMSHPNVCSPSPSCWYQPTTCYNCHKNGGG